jgi:hypothetical protein
MGWTVRGSDPGRGKRLFASPNRPNRLSGPPSLLFSGCRGFFPGGLKRPGREVDHSPPSSPKIKNEWRCTAAVSVRLHGVDRDKYTFPLLNGCLIPVYKSADGIFGLLDCHDLWGRHVWTTGLS